MMTAVAQAEGRGRVSQETEVQGKGDRQFAVHAMAWERRGRFDGIVHRQCDSVIRLATAEAAAVSVVGAACVCTFPG